MLKTLIAALALTAVGVSAQAAELKRQGTAQAIISRAVVVPPNATTVYVSGITPQATNAGAPAGTAPVYGDTKTQTLSILKQIEEILKAEGMTMNDMVMLRVLLVADPAMGGKMDFAGMNAGYSTYFGTAANPGKPARITSQVAALVSPAFLVEIEGQAAKVP
jgi:enamine deaminase RidA (YjgF/YER057c/UK114 family)